MPQTAVLSGPRWAHLFFATAACAWVPHWSCHYYRLETGTDFVVGNWRYTTTDSLVAMAVYASLIFANIWATTDRRPRIAVATISGSLHLGFAGLHLYRLYRPFRFDVFGYPWSFEASLREAVILSIFGTLSLYVAVKLWQQRIGAYQSAPRTREAGAPLEF